MHWHSWPFGFCKAECKKIFYAYRRILFPLSSKQANQLHSHMKQSALVLIVIISLTALAATIDLNSLVNYTNQPVPSYITKNNTPPGNPISNKGATLGRVLFYDTQLSVNNTIACAGCHKQQFAFGDTAVRSTGLHGGFTGRHAMRLVNARFGAEAKFFWDERATTLEDQTTRPIQDHTEMGFSGANGDPGFDSLISRLEQIPYYQQLFTFVYGTPEITEAKIQQALAQFIRSIQSFDSRFDAGRAQVNNDGAPFPNFTTEENQGKALFLQPPPQGGAGCQGCHRAPEFDIDPQTLNNGVAGVAGDATGLLTDFTNTRAPSLRDIVNPNGSLNGPLMHTGSFTSLAAVIDHYNTITIVPGNTNLDQRLRGPGGQPQNLQLTQNEKDALAAFLKTLTGNAIYTDARWSDPFDSEGNLTLIPVTTGLNELQRNAFSIYPNPVTDFVTLDMGAGSYVMTIHNSNGALVRSASVESGHIESFSQLPAGAYFFTISNSATGAVLTKTVLKK
jgi:cytochrome c peroxidase